MRIIEKFVTDLIGIFILCVVAKNKGADVALGMVTSSFRGW